MNRILSNIELQTPDYCQRVGQTLLLPMSILFGHSYRIENGVSELAPDSLLKRVVVAVLAGILGPLTLIAALVGTLLLQFSATHKKAYEQIEGSKISITWNGHRPEIRTQRLLIRPIKPEDLPAYQALFDNAVAMQNYRGGVRNIVDRFGIWLNHWNEDPYSALAVVDPEQNRVIGHTIVGHGDFVGAHRGWSEMAVVIDPAYWNADFHDDVRGTLGKKGIGTEVVRATVAYARALRDRGYRVPVDVARQEQNVDAPVVHRTAQGNIDWAYVPLTELRATVSRQNPGAYAMSQTLAQEFGAVRSMHDSERDLLTLNLARIWRLECTLVETV